MNEVNCLSFISHAIRLRLRRALMHEKDLVETLLMHQSVSQPEAYIVRYSHQTNALDCGALSQLVNLVKRWYTLKALIYVFKYWCSV